VREVNASDRLDGMFVRFTSGTRAEQKQFLVELFEDRESLAWMAIAFIVVFASFLNDQSYTVQGIDRSGARPV
jgi:hypothetical protein